MGEYSEANIKFHQAIIGLGKCPLIVDITNGLFFHMRAIRQRTIFEQDRAKRSIVDHKEIVAALEARDTERAERLVREHTLAPARSRRALRGTRLIGRTSIQECEEMPRSAHTRRVDRSHMPRATRVARDADCWTRTRARRRWRNGTDKNFAGGSEMSATVQSIDSSQQASRS